MLARSSQIFRAVYDQNGPRAGKATRRGQSRIGEADVSAGCQWISAIDDADDRRLVRRAANRKRIVELAGSDRDQIWQTVSECKQRFSETDRISANSDISDLSTVIQRYSIQRFGCFVSIKFRRCRRNSERKTG